MRSFVIGGTWSRAAPSPNKDFHEVVQMPPEHLPLEVFQQFPFGGKIWGSRPRTHWRDCTFSVAWEHLGILRRILKTVTCERDGWVSTCRASFFHDLMTGNG